MKRPLEFVLYLILMSTFGFISCKKDTGESPVSVNQFPLAHAGPDKLIILPNDSVVLDGSTSSDPDGTIALYQWTRVMGPLTCVILNGNSAITKAVNLTEGIYQFELMVKDNGGLMAKDTVQVTVSVNPPPPPVSSCDGINRLQVNPTLTQMGELSVPRSPFVAAAGSRLVFAGGADRYSGGSWNISLPSSAVDIYDINTQTWTTAQLSEARDNMATAALGNKIFFAGGDNNYNYFNNVDIYDASTGTWSVAHLSEARTSITSAVLGNKVFFAGGTKDWMYGSRVVDIYDISTNTWSTALLTDAKMSISSVTDGNKVYFAGGGDWEREYNSIDIYDNATNSWSTSTMPASYWAVNGVKVGNTNYWIYWGTGSAGYEVQIKNLSTGAATNTCLPGSNYYPYNIVSRNNDIIFFSVTYSTINRIDIFHTVSGQWSYGLLNRSVWGQAIIAVNNIVYIGGGFNAGTQSFSNKVYTLGW
jgi:hypothetical protein